MRDPRALLVLVLLAVVAGPLAAQATIVVRNDGTRVEGNLIDETFDYLVILTAEGKEVKILAEDIKDIHYPDPVREGGGELEGAGTLGSGKGPGAQLTHEKEWPRDPTSPLETQVWELGRLVRFDLDEAAAAELLKLEEPERLPLFEELLRWDYTVLSVEQDELTTLWRTTLATALARTADPLYETLGRELADSEDPRQQHDATVILKHYNTPENARVIFEIFVRSVEPVSEGKLPSIQDIVIADEEAWDEAMDDVDAAYEGQEGLPGAAESALRWMGVNGLAGISRGFRSLKGEHMRASIYLIGRLSQCTDRYRDERGWGDEETRGLAQEAARILVPALGKDKEFLVDIFFAIAMIGEEAYPSLIQGLRSPATREWSGRALRRMSGEGLPSSYDRWMHWYKRRYGR